MEAIGDEDSHVRESAAKLETTNNKLYFFLYNEMEAGAAADPDRRKSLPEIIADGGLSKGLVLSAETIRHAYVRDSENESIQWPPFPENCLITKITSYPAKDSTDVIYDFHIRRFTT